MCILTKFLGGLMLLCLLQTRQDKKHRGLTTTMSSLSAQYPSQTLRVSNLVSYALLIAVNVASNSGLLGPTNAEISQKYSTPLTPSG